jgi:hypothetical protein
MAAGRSARPHRTSGEIESPPSGRRNSLLEGAVPSSLSWNRTRQRKPPETLSNQVRARRRAVLSAILTFQRVGRQNLSHRNSQAMACMSFLFSTDLILRRPLPKAEGPRRMIPAARRAGAARRAPPGIVLRGRFAPEGRSAAPQDEVGGAAPASRTRNASRELGSYVASSLQSFRRFPDATPAQRIELSNSRQGACAPAFASIICSCYVQAKLSLGSFRATEIAGAQCETRAPQAHVLGETNATPAFQAPIAPRDDDSHRTERAID